jgi:hypothetical protein
MRNWLTGRKKEVEEEEGYGEMSEETKMVFRRLGYVAKWISFILLLFIWAAAVGFFLHFTVTKDWIFFGIIGCFIAPVGFGFAILGLVRIALWIATGYSKIGIVDWLDEKPSWDRY